MRHASLCGTVLTKNTASSALRDIQFSTDTVDTGPTASGAQALRAFRPEPVHRTVSGTAFTPRAASVKDEFVEGEIGNCTSKPLVLFLKALQLLELLCTHTAVRRGARTGGALSGSLFRQR